MRRSLRGLIILGLVFGGIALAGYASALEYKSENVNVQFTFDYNDGGTPTDPTLGLTTPGNISITTSSGAAAVSAGNGNGVVVTSNSPSGYILTAKVGCATESGGCYNSAALKKSASDTGVISMMSSAGALSAGTWGISISSGTVGTGSTTFRPLTTTGTVLNKTTNYSGTAASGFAGGNTTPYTVGVYPSATQAAGTYTNKVTFMVTANV